LRDEYTWKGVSPLDFAALLDPERRGQQVERERDGEEDYFQHSVDGYADDAEWEEKQPDEWVGD
jgi:hypothetical protein